MSKRLTFGTIGAKSTTIEGLVDPSWGVARLAAARLWCTLLLGQFQQRVVVGTLSLGPAAAGGVAVQSAAPQIHLIPIQAVLVLVAYPPYQL